jgi:hypothetical protein
LLDLNRDEFKEKSGIDFYNITSDLDTIDQGIFSDKQNFYTLYNYYRKIIDTMGKYTDNIYEILKKISDDVEYSASRINAQHEINKDILKKYGENDAAYMLIYYSAIDPEDYKKYDINTEEKLKKIDPLYKNIYESMNNIFAKFDDTYNAIKIYKEGFIIILNYFNNYMNQIQEHIGTTEPKINSVVTEINSFFEKEKINFKLQETTTDENMINAIKEIKKQNNTKDCVELIKKSKTSLEWLTHYLTGYNITKIEKLEGFSNWDGSRPYSFKEILNNEDFQGNIINDKKSRENIIINFLNFFTNRTMVTQLDNTYFEEFDSNDTGTWYKIFDPELKKEQTPYTFSLESIIFMPQIIKYYYLLWDALIELKKEEPTKKDKI